MKTQKNEFDPLTEAFLLLLSAPFLWLERLYRFVTRGLPFYAMAYRKSFPCRNCGRPVYLVGQWRCGSHYEYVGHYLRTCPICLTMPAVARCYNCGVTNVLPQP